MNDFLWNFWKVSNNLFLILFLVIFGEQKTWFHNWVILLRSLKYVEYSFASINSAHFLVTKMADRSETELGAKIDRCFADSLLKIAGGVAIGVVTSVAIFKGRTFPIWLGTGIGECPFPLISNIYSLIFRYWTRMEQLPTRSWKSLSSSWQKN